MMRSYLVERDFDSVERQMRDAGCDSKIGVIGDIGVIGIARTDRGMHVGTFRATDRPMNGQTL